ncbi:E3 ubiquitin-protein ligase TRIM33-like [Crassostrea angulata]|uniref:E3 ubiquitin-protein ligase TRIM33-like n=1 Tax=Magallana angulata TaxID=2784310 RepID=UPI0022B16C1F|nr:E3 ubiquitin-protein ligase TRIM33-like [Crassostrea angulata]
MSNGFVAPEQFLHMFLKCHMCNNEFDEGQKHARLLPCMHSLCFECLNKTKVNDQLQCPTCTVTHSVSNFDETCPRDNTRRDLMDFVKVKHSLITVCCSVCPSEIATIRCTQCAEFLCDDCQKAHMRVSVTRNHSLFELAELKKSNNVEAFCRPLMCSKHPDTALNNYCTKTTCRKPVCVNCVIDSCREANDHKIENIDSVANAKRQLMKDQISNAEDVSKQIQSIINEIKVEQNKMLNMEKSVEEEIDKTFRNLERILWNRHANLKKTLKSNVLSKQSHLKAQEDNLRKLKLDIEESNKFANQTLSSPSAPALLQVYPTIQNKLNNLATQYFE